MLFPIVIGAVAVAAAVHAPGTSRPPSSTLTATAVRTRQAPGIDGRNDDAVWREAPRFSEFRQFEPRVDADPSFRTEFQVAYDEQNLYVFVRMFDPHPDSIMHALIASRRARAVGSDQAADRLVRRQTQRLRVRRESRRREARLRDEQRRQRGRVLERRLGRRRRASTRSGWTAEFRIPLSQLRYARAARHTFGFGVWRDIERYKERTAWPAYSPTRNGIVSQLGRLTGFAGHQRRAQRLEVTPYVVTKNVQRTLPNDRVRARPADRRPAATSSTASRPTSRSTRR